MIGENIRACCCDRGEEALLKRIDELAAEYRGKEGSLIQALHMVQGTYDYLPLEVQKVMMGVLDTSLAEVSGAVTSCLLLSTQPRGEYAIRVRLGMVCYARGDKRIVERLKELLDVEISETATNRK